jgi:CDP-diacylglycerol--glycerol-3-phosphate 3-phosphatidyltransferase
MFTAGYFNPHPSITSLLLSPPASSNIQGTVITASPWANGFFGSSGVSGLLPSAYTLLSRRFLDKAHSKGLSESIQLKEWRKGTVGKLGGWTYHAKGLWVTLPQEEEQGPSVTLVGSSNYTKRSYSLDLEMNTLIVTRDEDLKRRLKEEQEWLAKDAEVVSRDDLMTVERRVGIRVRVAMWIVKILGGEL